MKILNYLFLFFIISSCAHQEPFTVEKNCSDTALKRLKPDKASHFPDQNAVQAALAKFPAISSQLKSCYQKYLDDGGKQSHKACLVLETDVNGTLTFLDIEDKSNSLSPDLKDCLLSVLKAEDYSSMKSSVIVQPFNFKSKRQ